MPAPTHHITLEEGQIRVSREYQQLIDRRTAFYRKILVLRKLKEQTAITCFMTFMDELNEQFAATLIQSVRHDKRAIYTIAR